MTRSLRLDALRGVAVLAVFFFHMVLEFNIGGADGWLARFYSSPMGYFVPNNLGTLGVMLFFVISGYCIHQSAQVHERESGVSLGFWRRRFWRIYPLYLVLFVVLFVLEPVPDAPPVGEFLIHGLLLQFVMPGHLNHFNPSWWSLSAEAVLYLLYPVWHLLARRVGWAPLLWATVATCAAWTIWADLRRVWEIDAFLRWAFPWFLGVAVWRLMAARRLRIARGWTLAAVVAVAGVVLALCFDRAVYILAGSLAAAAAVSWAVQSTSAVGLGARAFAAVGRVSYALYLIHQPLLAWAGRQVGAVRLQQPDAFLLTGAGMLVICLAFAVPLEQAGDRLRRWAIRRRA